MSVTIGIPIYNEINFLKKTLKSLEGQYVDKIIISDNASTDGSSEICERFAAKHDNVIYIKHDNIGSIKNFKYCFECSDTTHFMWLGGHDILEEGLIEKFRLASAQKDDAALVYANAIHVNQDYSLHHIYEYEFAHYLMSDDPALRVFAICHFLTDCTMFHGLYKRSALQAAFFSAAQFGDTFLITDHAILAHIAMQGKMFLVPDAHYIRMNPRVEEKNIEERWSNIALSCAMEPDPVLFPYSVYKGQMDVIRQTALLPSSSAKPLELAKKSLIMRWLSACKNIEDNKWRSR